MSKIENALYNIRALDDLSRKDSFIHRIHPVVKLLISIIYIIVVVSYEKYEFTAIFPLVVYPVFILFSADIPIRLFFERILVVEFFIFGIGILNPVFDKELIKIGNLVISAGWITFFSIILKSSLTAAAAILMIATTGMYKLAYAMRMLKVPKIFAAQLLLTYRYIDLFIENTAKIVRAYHLRAFSDKKMSLSDAGAIIGQLFLRTMNTGERVYKAMLLRGFEGEYHISDRGRITLTDVVYSAVWIVFFIAARRYNLSEMLGNIIVR